MELIKGYATNYYEVLPRIVEKRDREFTEKFMNIMNPCFLAREEDETAFKTLRDSSAAKNNDFFDIFLKKQIETINLTKQSRVLCETYKTD